LKGITRARFFVYPGVYPSLWFRSLQVRRTSASNCSWRARTQGA